MYIKKMCRQNDHVFFNNSIFIKLFDWTNFAAVAMEIKKRGLKKMISFIKIHETWQEYPP
jgi:hypothetical protein